MELIEGWALMVQQPKHVVLTVRNTNELTREYIQRLKKALTSLRNSAFAKNWNGGCWSLEITNEHKGWHVHFHLLIDARWIDSGQLAIEWGKRVGQDFAIVKVMDARARSYLKEVTKYAVKGTEMTKWSSSDVAQFVRVMTNQNTHSTFGSLYKVGLQWRKMLKQLQEDKKACECGCREFFVLSETEWELEGGSARPPPVCAENEDIPPRQTELFSHSTPALFN
jgi:hypothetical protein